MISQDSSFATCEAIFEVQYATRKLENSVSKVKFILDAFHIHTYCIIL